MGIPRLFSVYLAPKSSPKMHCTSNCTLPAQTDLGTCGDLGFQPRWWAGINLSLSLSPLSPGKLGKLTDSHSLSLSVEGSGLARAVSHLQCTSGLGPEMQASAVSTNSECPRCFAPKSLLSEPALSTVTLRHLIYTERRAFRKPLSLALHAGAGVGGPLLTACNLLCDLIITNCTSKSLNSEVPRILSRPRE